MAEGDASKLLGKSSLTPYDLLGYLVPGGMFLAAIAAFEAFIRQSSAATHPALHTPVLTAIVRLTNAAMVHSDKPGVSDAPWVIQVLVLIIAGTVSYVTGHVVASFSALAIDRWYVDKAHGYPFRALLGLDEGNRRTLSKYLHRGFFFWLNLYLLLRFFTLPRGLPLDEFAPSILSDTVPGAFSTDNLKFLALIVGWGLVAMAIVMAALMADDYFGSRFRRWVLESKLGLNLMTFLKGFLLGVAAPGLLITVWLGTYLHSRDPLDPVTCALFKKRLSELVGVSESDPKIDELLNTSATFWYPYIHVRSSPEIATLVDNWLRLYGFARNLAAAFYLAFLYCLCWWLFQGSRVVLSSIEAHYVILMLPVLYFTAAFLLLLRYYYLYVSYFTKYVLRGFVYLTRGAPTKPSIWAS